MTDWILEKKKTLFSYGLIVKANNRCMFTYVMFFCSWLNFSWLNECEISWCKWVKRCLLCHSNMNSGYKHSGLELYVGCEQPLLIKYPTVWDCAKWKSLLLKAKFEECENHSLNSKIELGIFSQTLQMIEERMKDLKGQTDKIKAMKKNTARVCTYDNHQLMQKAFCYRWVFSSYSEGIA